MTIDPNTALGAPFNARFGGQCALDTCERHNRIEPGDVCQYLNDEIMHMVCARRVVREQAAPLCKSCWCYHRGDCA